MNRSYDTIAFFYDRLARLVYGKALINAQLFLISAIPPNARVLIAGGGTGWILEEIAKVQPSGIAITYIDASAKMTALAQKRNAGGNTVTFINAPVEAGLTGNVFDVIITPFLFDNFTDSSLRKVFSLMDARLVQQGLWLHCDFQDTGALWQKAVLKIMYLFFRSFCDIEARHLPDIPGCFSANNYSIVSEKKFIAGFVAATVYKKGT